MATRFVIHTHGDAESYGVPASMVDQMNKEKFIAEDVGIEPYGLRVPLPFTRQEFGEAKGTLIIPLAAIRFIEIWAEKKRSVYEDQGVASG